VNDIFQVVRGRFSSTRGGAERCATAMTFYRLRRALAELSTRSSLGPDDRVDALSGMGVRKLIREVGRRSGLRLPTLEATLLGRVGGWFMAAGLTWLLLAVIVARPLWPAGVLVAALGAVLIAADPRRLPPDCETLGGLARKVAGLNFGHLHAEGAKARDRDLWSALVEVLSEHTLLPKSEIHPETLILQAQLSSA
jgi:hypothetical protein